jgi:hypothetical protein
LVAKAHAVGLQDEAHAAGHCRWPNVTTRSVEQDLYSYGL